MSRSTLSRTEIIKTFATFIGIGSAVLYAVGYLAERIHWNLLGHVEVPSDHVEFLYRGGNVIVSSVADFILYLLIAPFSSPLRAFLIILSVLAIFAGRYLVHLSSRIYQYFKLQYSHFAYWFAFAALALLLVVEYAAWPAVTKDILFESAAVSDATIHREFYRCYVGVLVLWLILFIMIRSSLRTSPWLCSQIHEKSSLTTRQSFSKLPFIWTIRGIQNISAAVGAILFFFLPVVYGSYKYPNNYPVVSVILEDNAPEALHAEVAGTQNKMFLLYSRNDSYVLYRKSPEPKVFKVKRPVVAALKIGKTVNLSTRKSGLIDWLRSISGLRPSPVVLEYPHGRIFSEDEITFRWRCLRDIDHFVARVTEESEEITAAEIEKWRSGKIPGNKCQVTPEIKFDAATDRTLYWYLDVYVKDENGNVVLEWQPKQSFSFLSDFEAHAVRQGERLLQQWIQERPDEQYLLLLAGTFYASKFMFSHARQYFEKYLEIDISKSYSFGALAAKVVDRLAERDEKRVTLQNKLYSDDLDETSRIKLLADLAVVSLDLLDFNSSLFWINKLIPLLPEERKIQWITWKIRISEEKNIADIALRY